MKKGFDLGGKYRNDPPGSMKPRGKARSARKSGRDGKTLTGTEQRKKNELMRQFMKNPEGGGTGNTEAYRTASCWCPCGRHLKADGRDLCSCCTIGQDLDNGYLARRGA